MIDIKQYIADYTISFKNLHFNPWDMCLNSEQIIRDALDGLASSYNIHNGIAIHETAIIEDNVIIKSPAIIGPNCFIAAYSYLRGGTWLLSNVILGPSTEIKSSFLFDGAKVAHFNFVGNSIIGSNVNIEAGAIIANYRNENIDKQILCMVDSKIIATSAEKFGALIGDNSRIGANAVLAPGTIIKPGAIIKRLELVDQIARRE
jgi:NDP-sugar pyrophosphorylase family protein